MKHSPDKMDPVHELRADFRKHLEFFYAGLKLAPPYDSVEKAVKAFSAAIAAMPVEDQVRVLNDSSLAWDQYKCAFVSSGLHLKHRGIILGLIRSKQTVNLPEQYAAFLEAYTANEP